MSVGPCSARSDRCLTSDPRGRLVFNRAAKCLCRNCGKHVNKRAGPPQARDAICTAVHQMQAPVIHCWVRGTACAPPSRSTDVLHAQSGRLFPVCLQAVSVVVCFPCVVVDRAPHQLYDPLLPAGHRHRLDRRVPVSACKRKEEQPAAEQPPAPKKPRLVFTDLQRRTLQAIFKVSDGRKQPNWRSCLCLVSSP